MAKKQIHEIMKPGRRIRHWLMRESVELEEYIEMDKQDMRQIRTNVRAELKELFLGWVLPIAGMFLGAYILIFLLRGILICIYTIAG